MENYSPSHPTDEVDIDNSPNDIQLLSESIGKSKFSEPIEQPHVFDIIDRSKLSENNELIKFSGSINSNNFQHKGKRTSSKSPESQGLISHSRSRSRSKRRRSRSRSKNRRSRSRNRGDRSFNRDRDSGRDRRSRSRERRSRSKERKPRSDERRSRSREKRSKSRNSSKYNSKDSPSQHRSKDKNNDNIFSKMNELSNAHNEPVTKQKWTYDSDEEAAPGKRSEPMHVLETVSRYDDMKPLSNFNDNSNKCEEIKSFQKRNEFQYRRGGNDNFRGNQRNRQWEPRNSGRFGSRNDQRFNRNSSDFSNKEDVMPKWGNNNDENSMHKKSWDENKDEENVGAWSKSFNDNKSSIPDIEPDKKGFAADSDEEFGSWGSENKKSINDMLTAANLESQKKPNQLKDDSQDLPENKNNFAADSDEEFGAWGSEKKTTKVENDQSQNRKENYGNWNQDNTNTADDSGDEFGSWGKDRSTSKQSNMNESQSDSFNQPPQYYNQNQRPNFNRNNDGNQRFQGRRGGNNNFNRFQRPNNQDRFNNNFNSTHNNFNNNPSNFNNNFNNSSNNMVPVQPSQQQSDMLSQMPMQIPPYNFNPTQRPPQWPPMNNMNFPPMCNSQMPFNSLPILPQMQFSQINQQPPISMSSMMQSMTYIPPPPPSTQPIGINNSQNSSNFIPPPIPQQTTDNTNLLETIMTNVGLSSKSIRLQSDIFKPQPPQANKNSVNDSLHNIIKSAASTVLSRLVESSQKSNANNLNSITGNISDSMSMSPPSPSNSPPPPIKQSFNSIISENSDFILPPLPNYSDVLKTSTNITNNQLNVSSNAVGNYSKAPSSEITEDKRNRSDFESKGDWQERIALEVKNFLRPAYMSKKITKSDYKEIMKRCVTKISRSGVTEINTEKIEKFVLSYVDKYQKFRKGKQHGVVSSSEHELVM